MDAEKTVETLNKLQQEYMAVVNQYFSEMSNIQDPKRNAKNLENHQEKQRRLVQEEFAIRGIRVPTGYNFKTEPFHDYPTSGESKKQN